ncbi:acyltransferase family protein [Devriesea agamarum]|uniref:acyltransferase family protein n=1 Tax=Devriesea agamarum TaxID=472569 RepID=UPI00071C6CD5|nr:acyltransferase [Devriesea agamarum]
MTIGEVAANARTSESVSASVIGLDVLRGLAAILVVLGHSRSMLADALGTSLTGAAWQKVILLPTSFAQESVAVFFVLSGYLVGGQVLREVAAGRFSWRVYLAKRLSRLWTVLIPGLVLTLAIGILGGAMGGVWPKLDRYGGGLGIYPAVCNAAFLQEPRCGTYGSNDSLWSLAFEFWFYMIFAAATVFIVALTRRVWARAAVGGVIAVGCLALFGHSLLLLIPSWLFGVVLASVHARWKAAGFPAWATVRGRGWTALLVALLAVGMLASNVVNPSREVRFVLLGLCAAPLVLYLALSAGAVRNRCALAVARSGKVSFSVYVYHLPIVKLLVTGLVAAWHPPLPAAVVLVYVVAAVAYVLCLPLWAVSERNTHHVRVALRRLLRA